MAARGELVCGGPGLGDPSRAAVGLPSERLQGRRLCGTRARRLGHLGVSTLHPESRDETTGGWGEDRPGGSHFTDAETEALVGSEDPPPGMVRGASPGGLGWAHLALSLTWAWPVPGRDGASIKAPFIRTRPGPFCWVRKRGGQGIPSPQDRPTPTSLPLSLGLSPLLDLWVGRRCWTGEGGKGKEFATP